MKKQAKRPPKQKKPRKKSNEYQYHRKGPGSGSIAASAVWGGIKRAQANHKERTFSEAMDRAEHLPLSGIMHPEYEAHDCLTI